MSNCKECKYHRTSDMSNYGVCFRFPQVVNTAVNHWCGEFKTIKVEPTIEDWQNINVQVSEDKSKRGRKSANQTTE